MAAVSALRAPLDPGPRSGNGIASPAGKTSPELDGTALYGLAGDVVRTLAPETEADPAALLVSFLVAFGSAVGSVPRARADGADHPGRLFAVIVGDTAKARKGTSWSQVRGVMHYADPDWTERHIDSGLSSGEGLIERAASNDDRRLLIVESEFAKVLTVAGRDGNTLSAVLRDTWDTGDLRVMTRGNPITARGAHVSVLGHITREEVGLTIGGLQAANGFANRFLWAYARRSKLLPSGGNLDEEELEELGRRVAERIGDAKKLAVLTRSTESEARWAKLYEEIAQDDPGGLLGGLVSRGEAQLLRLSVVYALTDGSRRIETHHLEAASALWRYCRDSADYIFGDRLGDPVAERVCEAAQKLWTRF
jgi:hypothetical protein